MIHHLHCQKFCILGFEFIGFGLVNALAVASTKGLTESFFLRRVEIFYLLMKFGEILFFDFFEIYFFPSEYS